LGYEKNAPAKEGNYRNGTGTKTIKTNQGSFELEIPRDRNATFEPQIVAKYQRSTKQIEEAVIHLYSQGLSLDQIQDTISKLYNSDISESTISMMTDAVLEEFKSWKNKPLDKVYPIIYMDGIYINVYNGKIIEKHVVYILMGVNLSGKKEILSMWISNGGESSKFWLNVLTDIKNRGVQTICISCVDGLVGFPEAINSVFPNAVVQQCIVHAIRRSLSYLSYKDRKEFANDLKKIYKASTIELALVALDELEKKWQKQYPAAIKLWRDRWDHLSTFFQFTDEIRRAVYTTNAIESINNGIRRIIKNKRSFPSEDAALKVIYLALNNCQKKWTMPIKNWASALNQLVILFDLNI
jgi:transposase-like protein